MDLPVSADAQAYCTVSALEGGILRMETSLIVKGAPPEAKTHMPCLAFLLVHSRTGHRFVFDLGIRKDWENHPPPAIAFLQRRPGSVTVDQDVVQALAKGGISPSDIDTVCLSHVHFDHVGDPNLFPTSSFVVGAETEELLKNGYPGNPKSYLSSELFSKHRTNYLTDVKWQPIGPFSRAFDFFDDGSLYIVDAPGHMPGHINVLARTSTDGGWIYLAGDSVHDWGILEGKEEMTDCHPVSGRAFCLHQNKEAATEQIRRMRELLKFPRVRVLLAHDLPWYQENKGGDSLWPGSIPSL